ncbi:N-6 DNA methylase [Salmonella enterica]|uniref:site-specific DNA-methyltransferase (adenine-specific) n=1 Tax=Salmonella enterica subsp. enterica serovar Hofit TaxID=2564537 RepID=A0A5W8MGL0_SALET|nr:SAM-dependent methyltransferase [Salmonella enterica]EBS3704544.1 SAM-dependent methyltransferase [Salmonella enterica subsp. enterica serovar Putten]EBY1554744.1 SAM-dependent methyltransferase [Salmonella enterica subsp. enterica serovar Hofit]ECF7019521.1 SAM-dependent methyltransferase [Salmonella enterica subsp. arizonae]EDW0517430.1 N-6 DNA methylase [Salmonella enterica subsp. enterica]
MKQDTVIQKIWSLCNILRGDGITYYQYVSELSYLLFLKIAQENGSEKHLPEGCRWADLVAHSEEGLLGFYQEMLTRLGASVDNEVIKAIYAFPTTVFSHSANLKAVIDGISKIEWHQVGKDGFGELYSGLIDKSAQDSRSGAGQYFTPRPLVESIIRIIQPTIGEVIQDPATGSGGFLVAADSYIRKMFSQDLYQKKPPRYQGVEIEKNTRRICLMNTFLHKLDADIIYGDALTDDANDLDKADVIVANPPFGNKAGSMRTFRKDIPYPNTNKQLAFLQHIYLGLKEGGRAAVVLPDNVLFESGVGTDVRRELMSVCNLHTILRLPTGIFYAQGVKTNVLFFTKVNAIDKSSIEDCTKDVWVYDLRTNMPSFGKRTAFSDAFLEPFERVYGENKYGQSPRQEGEYSFNAEQVEIAQTDENQGVDSSLAHSRWRKFSRDWIREHKNDSLDISWLKDKNSMTAENLPEPEMLARQAKDDLEAALNDLDELLAILDGVKRHYNE